MEIIPAILPRDFNEIEEKTLLIKGLSKMVQIDICDGKFVPSTSWPYKKHDEPRSVQKAISYQSHTACPLVVVARGCG